MVDLERRAERLATPEEIEHEHAHGADGVEVMDPEDEEDEDTGPTLH